MPDPIETFLSTYPPHIQAISRTLRAIAQGAMPGANELLFASQNHFAYSNTQSSHHTIVYICPMKDYVRLGFMFGGSLPDPDPVLVGEGKRLRHVKVSTEGEASNPALQRLVEAAWEEAAASMK
jgi:hypothetical protein